MIKSFNLWQNDMNDNNCMTPFYPVQRNRSIVTGMDYDESYRGKYRRVDTALNQRILSIKISDDRTFDVLLNNSTYMAINQCIESFSIEKRIEYINSTFLTQHIKLNSETLNIEFTEIGNQECAYQATKFLEQYIEKINYNYRMFFAHEKHQNGFTGNDIFNILSENLMLYPSKFLQRNVYINGYSSEIKIKYEYYSSRNLTDAEINLFNIIKDNFATFYGNYIEDLRITEEARKIAAEERKKAEEAAKLRKIEERKKAEEAEKIRLQKKAEQTYINNITSALNLPIEDFNVYDINDITVSEIDYNLLRDALQIEVNRYKAFKNKTDTSNVVYHKHTGIVQIVTGVFSVLATALISVYSIIPAIFIHSAIYMYFTNKRNSVDEVKYTKTTSDEVLDIYKMVDNHLNLYKSKNTIDSYEKNVLDAHITQIIKDKVKQKFKK